MSFISYAQNFEDIILWRALSSVSSGFYIDIGAQHPINDSVSLAFYKKGWRGVHVEPTRHYSDLLRKYRPDETVIQVAISDACSDLTFYEFINTGLSTANANVARQHSVDGYVANKVTVPAMSFCDLLEKFKDNEIHWLKIDVEGCEASVLRSWGDSKVKPWILCVESTAPRSDEATHLEWEYLILQKGYIFSYFDGLNRYYISNNKIDLLKFFINPVSVQDDFQVSKPISVFFRLAIDRGCRKYSFFDFAVKKVKIFYKFVSYFLRSIN